MAWIDTDRRQIAEDQILDAAATLFADGQAKPPTMAAVAEAAGCSRATIYNYFDDRDQLVRSYVNREAVRLAREVGARLTDIGDPVDRLVTGITETLAEVRADPSLMHFFTEPAVGIATSIAAGSEVVDALVEAFTSSVVGQGDPTAGRWILRVILSLLTIPEADAVAEQVVIERHVVASLGLETH